MRAMRFASYGGSDVLEQIETPEPQPGPGQIRIAVYAAGVNAIDWKIRAGHMHEVMPVTFPAGLGMDAAGVVDAVGEGVEDVHVGDAVFGNGTSTYAEHAVLSAWTLKPASLSFAEAAGYPVAVETAVRVLNELGVQAGQTLLVSGASGGVGSALVQIARQRDITVIGTASAVNQDYVTSLGAIATTYGDGLVSRVRALAPQGVDAAADIAGSGVIAELVELTGDPQRVLSIADFSAAAHGARVSFSASGHGTAYREAVRLFEGGNFRLRVEHDFPLHQAAAAHDISEAGHAAGRTVLTVR